MEDNRQFAESSQKNRQVILDVLLQYIKDDGGNVLEIAAGTGEHSVFFALNFPQKLWFPTDISDRAILSIKSWIEFTKIPNIQQPRITNVQNDGWESDFEGNNISTILCINMIHIAPWEACLGLLKGAGKILKKGGILYFYGAYKQGGEHTSESNAKFDESLRGRNESWGVRNLETVIEEASLHQLSFVQIVQMPSNNLSVIFQKL